jgi:HEAT repeat protein
LLELLAAKEPYVRLQAIQVLAGLGPKARAAWAALREVRRTTHDYLVYSEASIALYQIDEELHKEVKQDPRPRIRNNFSSGSGRTRV